MPRDLPSLNALRSFEAAARLESVSQAADELHVTHGAVSRQLRALEEELGVALFEKSGRGLKLTGSGRRLRDACGQAFADLRQACESIRREDAQAPLLLACPGSLLARWFIPRLDRLHRELPELNLHLSASEAELDPRRPGIDATLLFTAPPWPADLQAYPLLGERIGPVLSPRLPGAERFRHTTPDSLLDAQLLHTASRPGAWSDWARSNGLQPDAMRLGQGFEHLYYLLEAALAGIGVAIAPELLVADDLAAGRLVAPWGFVDTGNTLALLASSRQPQGRITELAHWLQANLGMPAS